MFICPCDRIPLFTNYPVGPLIMSYWTCCWSVPPPGKAISCCTALVDPSNPQRSSCSLSSSHQSVERSRKVSLTIAENPEEFLKDWFLLLLFTNEDIVNGSKNVFYHFWCNISDPTLSWYFLLDKLRATIKSSLFISSKRQISLQFLQRTTSSIPDPQFRWANNYNVNGKTSWSVQASDVWLNDKAI